MASVSTEDSNVVNSTTARPMLTTVDNPYSPFTEFDAWYMYDTMHGYNTCGLLDRIAFSSTELSEQDQREAINFAIDEIVEINASGIHKKVYRT